jgi:hypothetical protein
MQAELPLRIVMEHPLPGVAIALQRGATGKGALVGPVHTSADALVFDLTVTLDGATAEGGPRLLGPFVQGPPTARFVYLNAGASAGQFGSIWQRRAKIPLSGIGWKLIEELTESARLEAHIAGKGRDGGPACATVPLLPPGWRLISSA